MHHPVYYQNNTARKMSLVDMAGSVGIHPNMSRGRGIGLKLVSSMQCKIDERRRTMALQSSLWRKYLRLLQMHHPTYWDLSLRSPMTLSQFSLPPRKRMLCPPMGLEKHKRHRKYQRKSKHRDMELSHPHQHQHQRRTLSKSAIRSNILTWIASQPVFSSNHTKRIMLRKLITATDYFSLEGKSRDGSEETVGSRCW